MEAKFSVLVKSDAAQTPFHVIKTASRKAVVKCQTLKDALSFMSFLNGMNPETEYQINQ